MCSLFRLYSDAGRPPRARHPCRISGYSVRPFIVALYACTLPPTERLAGVGRAQLLVVWSCEITPYCKAFWRCLQPICDLRLAIYDWLVQEIVNRKSKNRKLIKGTTSRARRRKASLAVRPVSLPIVAAGCVCEKGLPPISALLSYDLGCMAARSRRWGTNPSTPAVAAIWPKIRLDLGLTQKAAFACGSTVLYI